MFVSSDRLNSDAIQNAWTGSPQVHVLDIVLLLTRSSSPRTVASSLRGGVTVSVVSVFIGLALVGGWLFGEGLHALRARERDGVAWMLLGVIVIALGGTIMVAL